MLAFAIGVAMPFADAARAARGEPRSTRIARAAWRSAVLVVLGVFLASNGLRRTSFTFDELLAQIGLAYTFAYLLMGASTRVQVVALVAILAADWALYAAYPLPSRRFPWVEMGVPPGWAWLRGFAEHWEKSSNAGAAFDRWFLNLFPQPGRRPFRYNDAGHTTLNFIPTIATMLAGALAGHWLRAERPARAKTAGLMIVGAVGIVLGMLAMESPYCPVVPRLSTPSWVLYSVGWSCWMLALFYHVIEVQGWRGWAFPLVVAGVNALAIYLMARLMKPWLRQTLDTHIGREVFAGHYGPMVQEAVVLLLIWLVGFWMYRNRIFPKV
jgi:predicted acyltransferase